MPHIPPVPNTEQDQDSGFSPRTVGQLDRAEAICVRRGVRMTELRRRVLGLVLDSARPVGAYEVLDQLRLHRRAAAPPTVYRALDFLLEQGLIHKVERLSAFVGCGHAHDHTGEVHHHAVQFLICRRCGRATELNETAIDAALMAAARREGFHLGLSTVEADGICSDCATLDA